MRYHWLNRQDNPECILFMAGWGMGPEPFWTIVPEAVDVLMVYDYSDLENLSLESLLPGGCRLHLLAWSMGVWAAGLLLQEQSNLFSSCTAIGGTCKPIDDRCGIPEQVFERTIADLSPASLDAFYLSMFEDDEEAHRFLGNRPSRGPDDLKHELIMLQAACRRHSQAPDIFSQRIVTGRDRVFPSRNQIRAWGRENCSTLSLPHFPFYQWPAWEQLFDLL